VLALNSAKLGLLVAFGEGSHGIGAEMYSQWQFDMTCVHVHACVLCVHVRVCRCMC
jgi:hypothetical protein